MLYGILKSKDVKLTHIGRALKENTKMKHTKKRLSRNVSRKDISEKLLDSYLLTGKKPVGSFNPTPSLQIHFLLDKLPSKPINLPIILIRVSELIFGRRKGFSESNGSLQVYMIHRKSMELNFWVFFQNIRYCSRRITCGCDFYCLSGLLRIR
jgi:hypothetical protein